MRQRMHYFYILLLHSHVATTSRLHSMLHFYQYLVIFIVNADRYFFALALVQYHHDQEC